MATRGHQRSFGLPELTTEEKELQAKFALIQRKKKQLKEARAKAQAPAITKRPSLSSINTGGGAREAAKKVLASEAARQHERDINFRRPKALDKKTKEPMLRPLDDDTPRTPTPSEKPFRSVLSGGADAARRDYTQRFVSSGSHHPTKRPHHIQDEPKCNTIQVTGQSLSEELLRELFHIFGEIELVKINATNSLGFVVFFDPRSADQAARKRDNELVNGSVIQVMTIEGRAVQAADFSPEALRSPWASAAAGVSEKRRDSRRMKVYEEMF